MYANLMLATKLSFIIGFGLICNKPCLKSSKNDDNIIIREYDYNVKSQPKTETFYEKKSVLRTGNNAQ